MSLLRKSFLHPLRDRRLLLVYASLFLGALSSSFLSIYLSIDMVHLGYASIVTYLEAWLGVAGLVLFPIFFYSFTYFSKRIFISLVLGSQIIGTVLLAMTSKTMDPLYIGLVCALFATAYHQMLHMNLAAHTSDENRGFEMSLAQSIAKMGSILGAALGGWIVSLDTTFNPVVAAFILQLIATVGFAATSPIVKKITAHETAVKGTIHVENLLQTWNKYPRQNWGTAAEAFFELIVGFMMPIWMTLQGIASAVIGLLKGFEALLAIFMVPLVGKIVHRKKGEEFTLGSAIGVAGWLPFLLGMSYFNAVFAIFAWSTSARLIGTGLETRRYSRRSATQIFVREIILTLVRIPSIPLLAWMAFNAKEAFIILGIAACLTVGIIGKWISRSVEEATI